MRLNLDFFVGLKKKKCIGCTTFFASNDTGNLSLFIF